MAHIRPDVNPGMNGLLKEQPGSQLFTVFGQPRTTLAGPDDSGQYTVTMEGMDIYNPVENTISVTGCGKGSGMVSGRRLRRSDVLHHPGVFPGQVGVGKIEQGSERPRRRYRRGAVRGAVWNNFAAVSAGQVQMRGGEGD